MENIENNKESTNIRSYIGKRGYIIYKNSLDENTIKNIKKNLTVKPNIHSDYGKDAEPFSIYYENSEKLYIPKFYGYNNFGYPKENRLNPGLDVKFNFNGELKPHQIEPIKCCMNAFNDKNVRGGILAVGCGQGKTVMGLNLMSQVGKKTLVIVHKEFLLNQWKERIEQFLPDAKIGYIRQEKIDHENKDIVIAMLQSVSMKDYALNTFDTFGFVVIDECHRIPCQVFSKALIKINSKYMLGLSATPNRKDGLTKVLKWHIGEVVYSSFPNIEYNVLIQRIFCQMENEDYKKEVLNYNNKPNIPKMVSNIVENLYRTKIIVYWLQDLLKDGEQRKVIILSERRNHLDDIYKIITERNICTVGYYVGGMKEKSLKESEEKTVLLGTYSMASEGLDVPGLNALILASPKSDIVQSVGRILRKKHEYLIPRIIDMVDNHSLFNSQSNKRLTYYKSKEYNIEDITIDQKFNILSQKPLEYKKRKKRNKNNTVTTAVNNDNCSDSEEDDSDNIHNKNSNRVRIEKCLFS